MDSHSARPAFRQVLLVEDDDSIRLSLTALLELEGYHVFAAANGKEALLALKSMSHPSLILLDLYMPVMSGMEFLSHLIKIDPSFPTQVPVIVLTASPMDGEAALSVSPFIKKCIQKPFSSDFLLEQVGLCATPLKP